MGEGEREHSRDVRHDRLGLGDRARRRRAPHRLIRYGHCLAPTRLPSSSFFSFGSVSLRFSARGSVCLLVVMFFSGGSSSASRCIQHSQRGPVVEAAKNGVPFLHWNET